MYVRIEVKGLIKDTSNKRPEIAQRSIFNLNHVTMWINLITGSWDKIL